MPPIERLCRRCRGRLELRRTWRSVFLRCRVCGAEHSLAERPEQIDDALEAELGDTRCDRL